MMTKDEEKLGAIMARAAKFLDDLSREEPEFMFALAVKYKESGSLSSNIMEEQVRQFLGEFLNEDVQFDVVNRVERESH